MHANPSKVLTSDEVLAADLLFAELLAERDPQSPVVDLAVVAAAAEPVPPADRIAAAS